MQTKELGDSEPSKSTSDDLVSLTKRVEKFYARIGKMLSDRISEKKDNCETNNNVDDFILFKLLLDFLDSDASTDDVVEEDCDDHEDMADKMLVDKDQFDVLDDDLLQMLINNQDDDDDDKISDEEDEIRDNDESLINDTSEESHNEDNDDHDNEEPNISAEEGDEEGDEDGVPVEEESRTIEDTATEKTI